MTGDLFHVYDTTLRDGAQQEGLNLSVADKLAIARQIDGLGVGFIEGGWPGANPKDTEFFRRAREELHLEHAQLAAFGATRRAGVTAADDPLVAALRDSGAGVVTLVAKSHDRHVELALRTTLEENLAMVRDTVAHLTRRGAAGVPRRRALLRRLPRQPRLRARGAAHGVRGGCRGGRAVRHQRRHAARLGRRRGRRRGRDAPAARVGHPLPQRHRLRGRQHAVRRRRRRDARAGHAQRVRRAHRQRRPGQRGRQPRAQARPAGAPRRPAARGDPDRARGRRRDQLPAGVAPALRRRLGLRAQGRPARQRDQGRPEPLPAHGPRGRRQRHAAARLRHGRPRLDRAQGPRARLRPRRPTWSTGSPRGSRSSSRAGYTFEAADASFELLLARGGRGRASVVLRGRVVARHHRDPARATRRPPRRP